MNIRDGKYAWLVKIGEKGQFVIPKEARDVFNIKNGDSLILFGDIKKGIAISKYDEYVKYAESIFNAKDKQDKNN